MTDPITKNKKIDQNNSIFSEVRRTVEKVADLKMPKQNDQNKNSNLRNVIKKHQEEFHQPKPFSRKYRSNNSSNGQALEAQNQNQLKEQKKWGNTKQAFKKKLDGNKIKDKSEDQSVRTESKKSFRIKKKTEKVEKNSKQVREELIALNNLENQIQHEILQIHNKSKNQIEKIKEKYNLSFNKKQFNISPTKTEAGERTEQSKLNDKLTNFEQIVSKIDQKLKKLKKQQTKLERKFYENGYIDFLRNMPQDIQQVKSDLQDQDEDDVKDLPPQNKGKIPLGQQSTTYTSMMPSIKNKNYKLNVRRTYDIFKPEDNISRVTHFIEKESPQKKTEEGNKVTVNNNLIDILLN